jgi:hypothetical protein
VAGQNEADPGRAVVAPLSCGQVESVRVETASLVTIDQDQADKMAVAVAVEAQQAILGAATRRLAMSRRVRPVNPTWRLSQWMREPSLPVKSRLATHGCAIPDNRQHTLVAFQATVEKLGLAPWPQDRYSQPLRSYVGGFETIYH